MQSKHIKQNIQTRKYNGIIIGICKTHYRQVRWEQTNNTNKQWEKGMKQQNQATQAALKNQ